MSEAPLGQCVILVGRVPTAPEAEFDVGRSLKILFQLTVQVLFSDLPGFLRQHT